MVNSRRRRSGGKSHMATEKARTTGTARERLGVAEEQSSEEIPAVIPPRDPDDQTPGIGYIEPPTVSQTIVPPTKVYNVSDEEMHRGDQETDPKKIKAAQLKQAGLKGEKE